ncbi:MAG: hypothetical protein ACK4YF_05160 [Exilispira sp.]
MKKERLHLVIIFFLLIFFIFNLFSLKILSQTHFINFSILSMFRTCEMIEITGNEDQFDIILNTFFNYSYNLSSNWFLFLSIDLNFRLPYSTKARFYEYFAPDIIEAKCIGFYFINKVLSFNFEYAQNLALGYHFENYYPATVQKLPSYPFGSHYYGDINTTYDYTFYLPYPAFMLGGKQLPIYYVNAIYLYDCQFYLRWNFNKFYLIIGTSTGDLGLDSNSSKSAIVQIGYENNRLKLFLSMNLTEKGSVPIKIHSQFFTLYFNYIDDNFIFAIEGLFNLHGIRDPRLNPYTGINDINIEIFNYGSGLFIPDDLPNIIDPAGTDGKMPPLLGAGGFIYLSYIFYFNDYSFLKIFAHFSLYDPNIKDESHIIYKLKYRVVLGFNLTQSIYSMILGATFTYDKVFLQIPQFYEAESRVFHHIANYDLIICIIISV